MATFWKLSPVLLLASAMPALAQGTGYGGFDHPHMGYGADGIMGPIFMLVLLAALIVGIVALLRWMSLGHVSASSNAALDMLNLRFAKGELDQKEYEERKKALLG
jgi:putative membrane protein